MKNLQSLLFNNTTGKIIYGNVARPIANKKKEIKPIVYNTYVFSIRNSDGFFFRDGLYLSPVGIHDNTGFMLVMSSDWYCQPSELARSIDNYYSKTFKCSLDYILSEMERGESIEFNVKMTVDDYKSRVLTDSIIEAFIDAFIAKRYDQIVSEEQDEWLANEYYYV